MLPFQENADEIEMLKRVDEITDKLLREKFPDAYTLAPKKKRVSFVAHHLSTPPPQAFVHT